MTLLVFSLLCFISMLVGAGMLYMLGFRDFGDDLFILSPFIALCFWAVCLGIGVSLGITVRTLSYMIWAANLLLSVLAFQYFQFKRFLPLFAGFISVALLASIPYLLNGFEDYAGSLNGWSYIAFGQYLWEYSNCSEGNLAPLYQYSAYLCHTRFVSAGLLGLLSPLTGFPGDTQAAGGYFLSFSFFIYAATCYFFFKKYSFSRFLWAYIIICVVNVWTFYVMVSNNFDQALSLGLLPALAGLAASLEFSKKRHAILIALVLAAIFHIYPEMSLMIFAFSALMLAYFIYRERPGFSSSLEFGGWVLLVFTLLSAVFMRTWLDFPVAQISSSHAAPQRGNGSNQLIALWWLACFAVIYMAGRLEAWLRSMNHPAAWVGRGVALLVISFTSMSVLIQIRYERSLEFTNIGPYRQLQSLDALVFDAPLGVFLNDPKNNLWAMYYLRDLNTYFIEYRSYPAQSQALPFMKRSRSIAATDIQYVLVDEEDGVGNIVWSNSVYALIKIKDGNSPDEILPVIENPNGVERDGTFFWLGDQPAEIIFFAPIPGTVEVTGTFILGSSYPESPSRLVSVQTDSGYYAEVEVIENPSFTVPVEIGMNRITLQSLDKPTVPVLPNGDTRILLVGVGDLKIMYATMP